MFAEACITRVHNRLSTHLLTQEDWVLGYDWVIEHLRNVQVVPTRSLTLSLTHSLALVTYYRTALAGIRPHTPKYIPIACGGK